MGSACCLKASSGCSWGGGGGGWRCGVSMWRKQEGGGMLGRWKPGLCRKLGGEGIIGNGSEPPPAGLRPVGRKPCEENLHLHPRSPSQAMLGACRATMCCRAGGDPPTTMDRGCPVSPGAQATCPWSWDTGHRTPCDRPGSHSMEWPRIPRRAYGRGGSHTRLWGSKQVTLLLCTTGVFPASEQR